MNNCNRKHTISTSPNRRITTLLIFLLSITSLQAQKNPFKGITYDSVVAYNFALRSGPVLSILNSDSSLHRTTVLPGKRLTSSQVNQLIEKLNDKHTYGGPPMACFEPRHAVIFYKDGKIVSLVQICFTCNNLSSSPKIPAQEYYFHKKKETISNFGFSTRGADWLAKFFFGIGLEAGR